MDRPIAIKVRNITKNFILPHQKANSVKSIITGFNRKSSGATSIRNETQHALSSISIDIYKGEFFGIVGRNGSGKSTLLKILAGIYQPTSGSVTTHGKLVPFIELGVGFNPELTGRENVYLNGAMLGFSEQEIDAMYDDIVSFAELDRFMDQKLKNYSSGMQVRLAFSMATRSEADILLVDEVLAVGDADFQRKCFDYFRKLKNDKKTVVFVTHDMNSVREYCDRAVLIEKSEIVKSGTSDEVASAYSKMFIDQQKNTKERQVQGDRWGDGSLEILDAKTPNKTVSDGNDTVSIDVRVRANKRVDNVALGFMVKSPTGMPIVGTNNQILKQHIHTLNSGATVELTWKIPNIFSEGKHEVTLSAISNGHMGDRWENALSFKVILEKNTPYVVSPHTTLEYSIRESRD